jgi:uncharacterized membrane protein
MSNEIALIGLGSFVYASIIIYLGMASLIDGRLINLSNVKNKTFYFLNDFLMRNDKNGSNNVFLYFQFLSYLIFIVAVITCYVVYNWENGSSAKYSDYNYLIFSGIGTFIVVWYLYSGAVGNRLAVIFSKSRMKDAFFLLLSLFIFGTSVFLERYFADSFSSTFYVLNDAWNFCCVVVLVWVAFQEGVIHSLMGTEVEKLGVKKNRVEQLFYLNHSVLSSLYCYLLFSICFPFKSMNIFNENPLIKEMAAFLILVLIFSQLGGIQVQKINRKARTKKVWLCIILSLINFTKVSILLNFMPT